MNPDIAELVSQQGGWGKVDPTAGARSSDVPSAASEDSRPVAPVKPRGRLARMLARLSALLAIGSASASPIVAGAQSQGYFSGGMRWVAGLAMTLVLLAVAWGASRDGKRSVEPATVILALFVSAAVFLSVLI